MQFGCHKGVPNMVSVFIDFHYGIIEQKNHSSINIKVIVIVIWQKINFRPLFGTQSAKVLVVFWHDNEVQIGAKVIQKSFMSQRS